MSQKKFEQHSDYELFLPGKSWLFANPSHGCPLECSYCIEKKDSWFQNKITHLYSSEQTIEEILKSPKVMKDKSPLTFYNFSDPFLPGNKEGLISILEKLDSFGWENKVGLISKVNPGGKYLEKLSNLNNLKIGIFVSYANLNPGLEKVSSESRIELMKDSKNKGLKTIAYVRPLVRKWITTDRIYELGDQISGKIDAIALSGIRLTPEIIEALKDKDLPIPEVETYVNKKRDNDLFWETTKILREKTNVPVFWHTSCAMSYVFNTPDYNSHDIREKIKKEECGFPCIDVQREICDSRKTNSSDQEVKDIINRLGKDISFEREGQKIILGGSELTREDVSFVRQILPEFVMKK